MIVFHIDSLFLQMNVLMFAMDAMSHMAYQRKMPKTYEYLKKTLGAVILNSYNIVGDATTAALIPMLTGDDLSLNVLLSSQFRKPGNVCGRVCPAHQVIQWWI